MPAKVTLKIVRGSRTGEQFVFDQRTTCVVGRNEDCGISLPDDELHKKVSRHHCLLDVNPPDIRVRDFGSLNGTYVNGAKIGQRESGQSPESGAKATFPERDLKQGDEIKIGETVLRVDIMVPTLCGECFTEISTETKTQSAAVRLCKRCSATTHRSVVTGEIATTLRVCVSCGADVSTEIGEYRMGKCVCVSCRANPAELVDNLLADASAGDRSLLAIQGYEIVKELGRGGMGAVYLARHSRTGKIIALKIMIPQVPTDEYAKESFLREAENSRALRHPNVIQLQDWGFSGGIFFFTLEYCDHGSVANLMQERGGKLSISEACEIISQALDGLEYAHSCQIPYVKLKDGGFGTGSGLVHRDLKPANLLLSNSAGPVVVKVADFGLAKAFDQAGFSGQTLTGQRAGTLRFMCRQQIINFKYVRPEVDVWAMAASLYNMLTGQTPRDFPKGMDAVRVVLESNTVPIRNRDSSIPKRLAEVIDLALVEEPSLHFKSATELKIALKDAVQ